MLRGTLLALALTITLAACLRDAEQQPGTAARTPPEASDSTGDAHEGLLYGRVTTVDGAVHEGRLRFGGDEEALWGNYFNGRKAGNPWAGHVPSDRLPSSRESIEILGVRIAGFQRESDLSRPFMARFGDIARIRANGRDLRVTLRSGTEFHLDRYAADDLADGVRVWDRRHGVLDLDEWEIRAIELLPPAPLGAGAVASASSHPLYGTVRTRNAEFTGYIQWNRKECLLSDRLFGTTSDGRPSFRFDSIRSIARRTRDSSLVTLLDGREVMLAGSRELTVGGMREVALADRGLYVDDPRYGRVLISWDSFERADFSPGGTGPGYGDFPPGRPLTGSVLTKSGRRFTGRLVFDLDESETTETLDAPMQGVDYTILFGLVASIVLSGPEARGERRARVTLHGGEVLQLERTGDLGDANAGMLIFIDGHPDPEYVSWAEIGQVDFDRPKEMNRLSEGR